MEEVQVETAEPENAELKSFFYSLDDIPAYSIVQMMEGLDADEETKQFMFDVFGRDLMTKTILVSPNLCVYHEVAEPGERVKPHRHGTHQLTYVIRGSLRYGNRVTTAGMGHYSPDRLYAWTAGDDGAEWIEIHAGQPQAYVT